MENTVAFEDPLELYNVTFTHIKMAGNGRHACLENGYWCWSNLFEKPMDLFKYLDYKHRWRNK